MSQTICEADREQTIRAIANGFGGEQRQSGRRFEVHDANTVLNGQYLSSGRPTARVDTWSGGTPSGVK